MDTLIFVFLAPLAVIGIIISTIAVFLQRKAPGATQLFWMSATAVGWLVANTIEVIAPTEAGTLLWAKITYYFISINPVVTLLFALRYFGQVQWLRPTRLLLLGVIPLVTIVLVQSNDWHQLFWASYHFPQRGSFVVMQVTRYGAWFPIALVYFYSCMLVASSLILIKTMRSFRIFHHQGLLMVVGTVIPLLTNLVYIFDLIPALQKDFSPIALGISSITFGIALLRYRLLDIIPTAREALIERMPDGAIVLDVQNRLVDINPAARQLLQLLDEPSIGAPVAQALPQLVDSLSTLDSAETGYAEIVIATPISRTLDLNTSRLYNQRGEDTGQLILLRDSTQRKQNEAQLLQQQRAMAILEERERLARDLHDGIGQVMGYVNTQSQAAQRYLEAGQLANANSALRGLSEVAQNAHADIRNFILNLRNQEQSIQPSFWDIFTQYVALYQRDSGLLVQVSMPEKHTNDMLAAAAFTQLLYILQEALTNTRKHAYANHVQVIFIRTATTLQTIVSDNGIGFDLAGQNEPTRNRHSAHCASEPNPPNLPHAVYLQPRFGLSIMQERATSVAGALEIRSQVGQGVTIVVTIPLQQVAIQPAELPQVEARPFSVTRALANLRVLLIDDQAIFSAGLSNLLTAHGIAVVGIAENGKEGLAKIAQVLPDVVLLDMEMPAMNGMATLVAIKQQYPALKVVMLTVAADEQTLRNTLAAGASGFLLKNLEASQFFALLEGITRDEMVIAGSLVNHLVTQASQPAASSTVPLILKPNLRQLEILTLIEQGLPYRQIADRLFLSEATIKYHVGKIIEQLQVRSRDEAIAYVRQQGWLERVF